jgi:hypothetical protein
MNRTETILLEPNIQYASIATKCIICNDEIILQEYNNVAHDRIFVCDKCKAAILKVRKEMEEKK